MKKSVIFVLIFLMLISFVNATCTISTSCSNPLVYAYADFNTHVSSSGDYSLCCTDYELTGTVMGATDTCNGAVPFYMSGETNAHIEKNGLTTQNYDHKLCLTGVEELTCETSSIPCLPEEFCLLKYHEAGGYTNQQTNAHAADCNSPETIFYNNWICCSGEVSGGGECLQPGDQCISDEQCCDVGQGDPIVGFNQYCSYGQYENHPLEENHCCQEGWYWDEEELQCRESATCYSETNSGFCNTISSPETIGTYLSDSGCVSEFTNAYGYWESCCYTNVYGIYDYGWCEINNI